MEIRINGAVCCFNIQFIKLFLGQLFSHFSDAIVQFLMVAILIQSLSSAGKSIAITFFMFLLPQFLISPFSGALCDKFSRKMILSLSSIYRCIIVVLLILNLKNISTENIYLFAFLIGIGAAFFYPAKMAAITNVVKCTNLKPANALNSSIGAVAFLFGIIGANYLIQFGEVYAFSIIALMYFTSAILTANMEFLIPQKCFKSDSKLSDMQVAFNYLQKHKKSLYIVSLSICLQFIVAVFSNSLNSLITDYYRLDFSDLTFLRSLLGLGIIVGIMLTLKFAKKIRTPHLFASGFIILCIALITAPICQRLEDAWAWLIPIGIADALIIVTLDTILQKVTPDSVRGKVFGLQLTLNTFSFLSGTIIVVLMSSSVNPLFVFKIIAIISLLMTVSILICDKSFRYFLLKATIGHIFLCLFRYHIEGANNIPKKGKIILAGNHTGRLDPFMIQMATKRQLWFVTGPDAFKVPIIRHLLKFYNVLPLKFGKGIEAVETAVKKLQAGEAVIIFPEGKFTENGLVNKFNRGVGIMAKEADCPIVPFAIQGGYEAWGFSRKIPRLFNRLTIQFGTPIYINNKSEKEIANELQKRVNFMKKSLERRDFYNIKHHLYHNFTDLMQEKGDIFGQNKALSTKNKDSYQEISYIELSRQSKKLGNYLIENFDIQKGDRIAILSESRNEFAICMFASIQTGATTVPLDVKLTINEHSNILNDCKPRILFTSSHYLSHALELKDRVDSIEQVFVIDTEENTQGVQNIFELEADTNKNYNITRSLDETALIVYTSGTTGNPKGVMISFGNIYSQLKDFEAIFKLSNKNTLLSILPLNHLLELNVGFFGMLYMGAKIVYIKNLSPKELTTVMKEKGITNMIVVPLVAKMLKNSIDKQIKKQSETAQKLFRIMYKISAIMPIFIRRIMFKQIIGALGGKFKCFVSGGAPLENDVAEFFERIGIPVFQGYGLTETSPTISTNYYRNNKIGTVGKPLKSVRVKIAENGEILASGPNVMLGYYNKPDLTNEVIDTECWFHTGDIGEIDKDGYLKITGRIKNMIVLGGGKKIFPEEVEAVLECSPLIKEVCVLSLKIKSGNKEGTEEVGAVIVPSDVLQGKDEEEIRTSIEKEVKILSEKSLAPYKAPTTVIIRNEELPKTSTRKVKRNELLKWWENEGN